MTKQSDEVSKGIMTGAVVMMMVSILLYVIFVIPKLNDKDNQIADGERLITKCVSDYKELYANKTVDCPICPEPANGNTCWTYVHSNDGAYMCKRMAEDAGYRQICQQACIVNGYYPESECVHPCQSGYRIKTVECIPN